MQTVGRLVDRNSKRCTPTRTTCAISALVALLACVAIAASPRAGCAQSGANPVPAKVTETLVGPWAHALGSPDLSPDGLHVAYAIATEKKNEAMVVHDEKLDLGFSRILSPLGLSTDGRHLAYWAEGTKTKTAIFIDHRPGIPWERAISVRPVWSVDGTRLAYLAGTGKKVAVVLDGAVRRVWDDLDPNTLQFSPDGKHFCYVALEGKKAVMVADSAVGPPYDGIDPGSVSYNSTSDKLAYLAVDGGRSFAVVNDVPDSAFDGIAAGALAWSPDGRHLAYCARRGTQWCLRVDGRPGPPFRALMPPVFSADGNHLAFWGADNGSAEDTAHRVLVRDGVVVGRAPFLAALCLSAEGSRIAYGEEVGNEWVVVVDGVRSPAFEGVRKGFPEFSPDGRHVTYVAQKGKRWQLVIDGEVRAIHDFIGSMQPGAVLHRGIGHLSYAARDGGRWRVFHDGGVGPEYDDVLTGGPTVAADGAAEYLAVRGDKLFRVRQEPGGQQGAAR